MVSLILLLGSAHNSCEHRGEVCRPFPILQCKGLPYDATPSEKQKHYASPIVDVGQGQTGGLTQGRYDRVDGRTWDADDGRVRQNARRRNPFPPCGPIERIFRIFGWLGNQDNILFILTRCMPRDDAAIQVYQPLSSRGKLGIFANDLHVRHFE